MIAPDLHFQAISAVVVGGVSIFGGSGTVYGAALGAVIFAVLHQHSGEIVFGNGRISQVGSIVGRYGQRCLIVSGPHNGALRDLYPILGIGGGSSLDAAKAISLESTHQGTCWDYVYSKQLPSAQTLPVVAVGTTAGSGSQVNPVAIIHHAVLDSSNLGARNSLAWADTLAGLATCGSGLGLSHGIVLGVGGLFADIPYGLALASVYRACLEFTWPSAVSVCARLAQIFDPALEKAPDADAAERCPALLQDFLALLDIACSLRGFGIAKEELVSLARQSMVFPHYKNNPKVPTMDEMVKLIDDSYYGERVQLRLSASKHLTPNGVRCFR